MWLEMYIELEINCWLEFAFLELFWSMNAELGSCSEMNMELETNLTLEDASPEFVTRIVVKEEEHGASRDLESESWT